MKTRIVMTLEPGHRVNFGSAAEPEYKTDGEEVSCDKKVAEQVVDCHLARYVTDKLKEEDTNGK